MNLNDCCAVAKKNNKNLKILIQNVKTNETNSAVKR